MNVAPLGSPTPVPAIGEGRRSATPVDGGAVPGAAPAAPPVTREERATLLERARTAAQQIESFVRSQGRNLEFRVDDATGVVVVRVRDARTGEVIRQIPNEAALRFAERLARAAPDEGAASLLLDEMV